MDESSHPGGPAAEKRKRTPARGQGGTEAAPGSTRDYHDNRFVYTTLSTRARGLAVGINMCPDQRCNFGCVYCEVHRNGHADSCLEVDTMAAELRRTLACIRDGRLRERPWYHALPDEMLELRHVSLSGDGEPTLCPSFAEAVQAVIHVRALGGFPFFKIVLLTNGSELDQARVQSGLKLLTRSDEIWIKLDGGTQAYLNRVNHAQVPLEKILANILAVGRQRPVHVQSLFPSIRGEEPPLEEIEQYAHRLLQLKDAGADIVQVQIFSASRPAQNPESGHLPLKVLSRIAHTVRQTAGLNAEVF